MLPPIEQISNELGSGGYQRPCSAAARLTSTLSAPGSTTATRLAVSISTARIRSVDSTMPPSTASAPPDSPEPGAARHDGDAVRARPAHRRLHVVGGLGPHGGERGAGAGVVGPVEAVLLHGIRGGDHDPVGQQPDELGDSSVHAPTFQSRCHAAVSAGSGGSGNHFRTTSTELGPVENSGGPARDDRSRLPVVGRTWQRGRREPAGVLSEASLRELKVTRRLRAEQGGSRPVGRADRGGLHHDHRVRCRASSGSGWRWSTRGRAPCSAG